MEIAKALILAGRSGDERPWPTAPAVPKHLFPIANRPILFHNLETLRVAGVLEVTILSAPGAVETIRHAVGDGQDWGLTVRCAAWPSGDGLRGALEAADTFVGDEPVFVQEGGALLRERMHQHIAAFAREGLDALALRLPDSAPARLREPTPGLLLSPRAISIVREQPAPIDNPVAGVRARGGRVRVQQVDGCLPCYGDQESLLEGNRRMLERIESSYDPASLDDCRIQGPVIVHPTAQVSRTLLRGPLIIGPGARISDAYVGPYTSLGANVVMDGAEVEYSIVLDDAQLMFVGMRIESSVIGRAARVTRSFDAPAALKLCVGDEAEVVLR